MTVQELQELQSTKRQTEMDEASNRKTYIARRVLGASAEAQSTVVEPLWGRLTAAAKFLLTQIDRAALVLGPPAFTAMLAPGLLGPTGPAGLPGVPFNTTWLGSSPPGVVSIGAKPEDGAPDPMDVAPQESDEKEDLTYAKRADIALVRAEYCTPLLAFALNPAQTSLLYESLSDPSSPMFVVAEHAEHAQITTSLLLMDHALGAKGGVTMRDAEAEDGDVIKLLKEYEDKADLNLHDLQNLAAAHFRPKRTADPCSATSTKPPSTPGTPKSGRKERRPRDSSVGPSGSPSRQRPRTTMTASANADAGAVAVEAARMAKLTIDARWTTGCKR